MPRLPSKVLFERSLRDDAPSSEGEDGGDDDFATIVVLVSQLDVGSKRFAVVLSVDQVERHASPHSESPGGGTPYRGSLGREDRIATRKPSCVALQ